MKSNQIPSVGPATGTIKGAPADTRVPPAEESKVNSGVYDLHSHSPGRDPQRCRCVCCRRVRTVIHWSHADLPQNRGVHVQSRSLLIDIASHQKINLPANVILSG